MLKLKLGFLFLFFTFCLNAQTFNQFEKLFKNEKNPDKKAYYALALNFDENTNGEALLYLKKQAKKSKKGKFLLKANNIIISVINDDNSAEIQDIISVEKEFENWGYDDFALTLSICEAYYLSISGDYSKASIKYDELYYKVKNTYLDRKKEYLPILNYNFLVFGISFHYFSAEDNEKALYFINDFIKHTDIEEKPDEYAVLLTNIGSAFSSAENYEKALVYYSKSIEIYKKTKNYSELDWNIYCSANAKLKLKKYYEALKLINSLKLSSNSQKTEYEFIDWELVELIRAEILIEKNDLKLSEELLNRISKENRKGILNENDWSNIYFLKYKLFKKKGDFKNSLYYFEKHGNAKDKFNRNRNNENLNMQSKFLQLEKIKIKSEVEKKALKREEKIRYKNELLIFSLLGFIIAIIFIF